jgi:chorismate synthase
MMKSNFGNNFNYTLFGESHSDAIGITIQGLPVGFIPDFEFIDQKLALRMGGAVFNTERQEKSEYEILCGLYQGKLTGTPVTVIFRNKNIKSSDYENILAISRPGHADYTGNKKYLGFNNPNGGGHFSGRLTTPLVFLGALVEQIIQSEHPEFKVCTHIRNFGTLKDSDYYQMRNELVDQLLTKYNVKDIKFANVSSDVQTKIVEQIKIIKEQLMSKFDTLDPNFPCISNDVKIQMQELAVVTKTKGDTLGGRLETIVFNPPSLIGEPFFNSVESIISSLLYSVPSVHGVSFGASDSFISSTGYGVRDEIWSYEDNVILTPMNHNSGINGGITNGEEIVINTVIKPISSLGMPQSSYNFQTNKVETLEINGRHDSTIINRIVPVIDAMICLGIYGLMKDAKND